MFGSDDALVPAAGSIQVSLLALFSFSFVKVFQVISFYSL